MAPYHYLDAVPPLAFAHRGGAAHGDENTTVAFARAVALGYRYLETDVRVTADGVAVVFHDESLERITDHAGALAAVTWRDLETVRVGGAAVVPRLADVLVSWPEVRFNLDVKTDAAVGPVIGVVGATGSRDRVLLAAFSDRRIAELRRLAGPRVATSLASGEVARLRLTSLLARRTTLGHTPGAAAAQVPLRWRGVRVVDRLFVSHAHRLGLAVHVWTVDDPAEMHRLLDLGVDGIMTDRIEVLRDVYRERGIWS